MPAQILPFDSYQIIYSSPDKSSPIIATITLFSAGAPFAELAFYPDGMTLPDNSIEGSGANSFITVNFFKSSFYDLLSILWNVKKLVLIFDSSTLVGSIADQNYLNVGGQDM